VDQVNDYLEMFKRMSNEEAGEVFYTRVSSCFVIAELYRVLPEDQRSNFREIYMRLVVDELPMVRRAAAQVFMQVAGYAESEVILDEYLQVMKSFATDEFQTVRVIGTDKILPFLKLLKKLNTPEAVAAASELLPIVKAAGEDLSWRIRLAISKGNVLVILSLGCSVISIASIICRFIFFTYAILAGLNCSCRE
jgi:hypothetical protein